MLARFRNTVGNSPISELEGTTFVVQWNPTQTSSTQRVFTDLINKGMGSHLVLSLLANNLERMCFSIQLKKDVNSNHRKVNCNKYVHLYPPQASRSLIKMSTAVVKSTRTKKPKMPVAVAAAVALAAMKKKKSEEEVDIYIGEYWFNGKCIKTYQKVPFITDIEICAFDMTSNYDGIVERGSRYQDHAMDLLDELKTTDEVLAKLIAKRRNKSNILVAGDKLIADLEKVDEVEERFTKEQDLELDEVWARGYDNHQQLWFSHIRVLIHAGILKNDFDNGVGFRLVNATMKRKDPMFKKLMESNRAWMDSPLRHDD